MNEGYRIGIIMKKLDLRVKRVAVIVEVRLGEPEFSGAGPDFIDLNFILNSLLSHLFTVLCVADTEVNRNNSFSRNFGICYIGDSSEIYFLLF